MKRVPCVDLAGEYAEIGAELEAAVTGVLRSGAFVLGPETRAFEEELAAYCGSRFAIGVGSGTEALILALEALGVGSGDEVITTPFTYFASVEAILRVGARPVFADLEPGGFNLDPEAVGDALTPRTRAVLPVHVFGQCADVGRLRTLTDPRGIAVVEDAAQAIGAARDGRRAGALGALGCFSFYPSKNLAALGDGGAVTTDDPALAERVRLLGCHGSAERDVHRFVGTTSRLDAVQAAALRVKLRRLDAWNAARTERARVYAEGLADVAGVELPAAGPRETPCWHQFAIRCRPVEVWERVTKALEEAHVDWRHFYPTPAYRQAALGDARLPEGSCPEAERACREVICLPIHPRLAPDEQARVVDAVRAAQP